MRPSLDLHGKHVHEAWKTVDRFIERCYYDNYKSCEVICGQGRIRDEIETWFDLNRFVLNYRFNTRTQGSYNVQLIKRKHT